MTTNEEHLYEKETHLYYNDYDNNFYLETYDNKIAKRFSKNKNCTITETITDLGTLFLISGNKRDLNIDIYD